MGKKYFFKTNFFSEHYIHGQIEKSKPQTVYPYVYGKPFNLETKDIDGSDVGSKNRINKFKSNDYNLGTKDIGGAQAGTHRKGITTERSVNPLNPDYKMPGYKELGVDYNPYGELKKQENRTERIKSVNKGEIQNKNDANKVKDEPNNDKIVESNKINNAKTISKEIKTINIPLKENQVIGFNNQVYDEEP